ncbi:Ig-like domain-containing protein [Cohaesibacter celericrescens]|uniref:Cadherin domain-containing protein n=1 Tax=Cohaesibacter celericrescens TaxID=2067669 RepID=A0A2N5XUH7_9HYPH|nr:Ig-like domain-containing protein [Cohaesibacter celericrescens]PLW78172.1 hypothetical protein C0081_05875 [Cohaesibacter celericrescens]
MADLNEAPVLSHEADNLQDFESDADGWSNTTRTDDGSSNTILGRFGFESGMEGTSTSLTTPDAAESTVIEFDLLEIDSWDGRGDNYSGNSGAEMIIIEVAGETIEIPMDFNWSNETASGTSGNVSWTLVTNDENTNDMFGGYNDQVHQVQITVNNPDSAIDFSISSSLDQSIADEAFGIDNVRISNFDADGNELLTVSENDTGASIAILSVADPDEGDSHTYAVSDERFEVVEQDGQMTLKLKDGNSLDHEVEDTVDVVVTVTDSGGLSDSQTLTINVGDVNEAPSLSADGSFNFLYNGSFESFSNGEHGGGDGTGWYQGATIDGWTQTDIDVHEAGHMGLGASDGDYHVDLAGETNGELSRVMDGLKDGDEYTVTLDLKSRGADGSGKGSAEDAAGQSVVQVSWNGEVIATIDPSVDGMGWNSYALNITAGSGDGSDTITFTEIGSDNNYGTILDNFQITDSDGFGVLENETGAEIAVLGVTDPDDADTHTYSVSDDRFEVVDNGSGSTVLKLKDGNSLDHETEATLDVTVTVTDSGGLSDSQTLTIDVGDLNEAVTANDGTSTTSENASLKGTATASDLDGDSITYSLSAGPTQGSVTVNADGSYSFVPGTDFDDLAVGESRTVSFDFTADDGNGLTDTGTISIEVTGTNDAPTAVDLTASDVTENNAGAVIGTLSSSDADTSDTHSYTVSDRRFEVADDGAGNMQLKLKDGVSLNHETEESVTLTVTSNDGNGGSFDQDFTINVADVNEAVTAYDYSYNISEGQNLGHSMMANDVDGDQASFKIVDGPSHGSIAFNSNPSMAGETRTNQGFQFSTGSDFDDLAAGETRTVTVDFEAADGNGSTDTGTLTFNVAGTNDGPTAVDLSSSSVTENNAGAVIGTLSTTDVDTSDTHTYSVSDDRFEVVDDGAGNMQLKLKDRVALDHETEENIALTITSDDGNGGTMSEDFTIAVADVNEGTRGLSITGTSMTSGQAGVINTTNWSDTENGYTVTAQNLVNGELSEASAANIDTWDSGLGANGGVTHTDSGMDNQLAYDSATGQSETVIVDFDKDVSSASFDFQHLYSSDYGEEGHYQAYNDGKLVGEGDFTETGSGSGTGTVDVAFDQNFDQIVFSSNMQTDGSNGSDYQITEVTYQEAPTADGNDVLTGSEGNDKIAGLSGDDTITGGLGDDIMAGGDGNDMFLYMIGDGSDHIDGGAGADWTDSIELFAADGSNSTQGGIGEEIPAGDDWTLNITSGSVSDSNDHEFLLSDDASGTIDFADGSQIEFENIDRIAW